MLSILHWFDHRFLGHSHVAKTLKLTVSVTIASHIQLNAFLHWGKVSILINLSEAQLYMMCCADITSCSFLVSFLWEVLLDRCGG